MLLRLKDLKLGINKVLSFKVLIPLDKLKVVIFKVVSLISIFKI
jgi:hypothetical protein